jgi:MmgE/PrpD C-terminal domain
MQEFHRFFTTVSLNLRNSTKECWAGLRAFYKPLFLGIVTGFLFACAGMPASGPERASKLNSNLGGIQSIEVTGHPLLRQRTDRPGVQTGRESQVSAQHAVAIALTTGRAGLEEFSDIAVRRSDVQALGSKLSFVDDARLSIDATRVELKLHDGSILLQEIDFARGSLEKPLSDLDGHWSTVRTWRHS